MPISAIRVPARRLTWRAAILSTAVAVAIMILGGVWVGLPAAASPLRFSPWLPPLPGTLQVISAFDPPAQNWLAGHRGVDLAATPGTPVQAAGGGIVTFAATVAGRGVVTVTHSSGRTTYEPVTASVDIGQAVDAGEVIGIVTGGGHCSERCLHWGYIKAETYLDPLSLLDLVPPVLKPLGVQPRSLAGGSKQRSARVQATRSVPQAGAARTAGGSESPPAVDAPPVRRTAAVPAAAVAIAGVLGAGVAVDHRRRRSKAR